MRIDMGPEEAVDALNGYFEKVATWFVGDMEPDIKLPMQVWVDTHDGLIKQRNLKNTSWIVRAPISDSWGVPVGTILAFAGQTPPDGYLECNGQAVSRTTYAALFAAIGTTWGSGDGSTTFNLPELRGEFLRGWDHGRGVDPGRALGSAQGDAIRNITGSFGSPTKEGTQKATGAFAIEVEVSSGRASGGGGGYVSWNFDASRVVPTANENRPRNKAVMYIIKY